VTIFDQHPNFGFGIVAVPPSPATSGITLTLLVGQGAGLTAPFPATLTPPPSPLAPVPLGSDSEIVYVTAVSGDTLTIERQILGTSARSVLVGDWFLASITSKALTDIETAINSLTGGNLDGGTPSSTYVVNIDGGTPSGD